MPAHRSTGSVPAKAPDPRLARTRAVAIALAGLALLLAAGAWYRLDRAERVAEEVREQAAFARAYEQRALSCLDVAVASIGDPAQRERAAKSLAVSHGIMLCLVRHREQALLSLGAIADCIAEVEATNSILGSDPAGPEVARPAC